MLHCMSLEGEALHANPTARSMAWHILLAGVCLQAEYRGRRRASVLRAVWLRQHRLLRSAPHVSGKLGLDS